MRKSSLGICTWSEVKLQPYTTDYERIFDKLACLSKMKIVEKHECKSRDLNRSGLKSLRAYPLRCGCPGVREKSELRSSQPLMILVLAVRIGDGG